MLSFDLKRSNFLRSFYFFVTTNRNGLCKPSLMIICWTVIILLKFLLKSILRERKKHNIDPKCIQKRKLEKSVFYWNPTRNFYVTVRETHLYSQIYVFGSEEFWHPPGALIMKDYNLYQVPYVLKLGFHMLNCFLYFFLRYSTFQSNFVKSLPLSRIIVLTLP